MESTSQVTLDIFNKNIQVEQSKRALELINEHDIVSETSFVLGMPGDTVESIRNTVELAKFYNPDPAKAMKGTIPQEIKNMLEKIKA